MGAGDFISVRMKGVKENDERSLYIRMAACTEMIVNSGVKGNPDSQEGMVSIPFFTF